MKLNRCFPPPGPRNEWRRQRANCRERLRLRRGNGGVVGRGEVVMTAADPDLEIRVPTHGLAQVFGDVEIAVLGVKPRADVRDGLIG